MATRTGAGGVVLVAGEAGIGKSRLVAEATATAAQQGYLILHGDSFEIHRAVPYAPWLDLLRGLLAGWALDDLPASLLAAAPVLLPLLPELSHQLTDVLPTPALDADQEKHRLAQALTRILSDLAAQRPILIAIDDLHWSDEASLDLLHSLARRLVGQPVLFLLTYRDDEVQPGLAYLLTELNRGRLATEVPLQPLTAAEVEAMLRAIFDQERPVRTEFVAALHDLTDGNPFFVEEVVKSLVMDGAIFFADGRWDRRPLGELHLPRTIEEAVRRRVARLSGPARETLVLAAVIGQRVDVTLLQALTGHDERVLLGQLKELMAAQLVVEESADVFSFRHALTRQAVGAGLLARERRALHRQVAAAIEQLDGAASEAHLASLAHHTFAAGLWEKALDYAQRAGVRAAAMHAPRAAAEHFTRALAAAEALGQAPSPALLRARGQVYETIGEFEAGRADLEAALAAARQVGNRRAEWQALLDLGFLWAARDYGRVGDYFHQALDLARMLGEPAALAHSLNRLGNWHLNSGRPLEARHHHEEALTIFAHLGDRAGQAATIELLALAFGQRGDFVQGVANYRRAIDLFSELDDRRGLAWSLANLAEYSVETFLHTEVLPVEEPGTAIRRAEQALALAREIGWRAGEAYALGVLSYCLAAQGECRRGLALARDCLALAEEIGHRQWLTAAEMGLGIFHWHLLALPVARQHLERALALAREVGSAVFTLQVIPFLASTYLLRGEPDQALALLDGVPRSDVPADLAFHRVCQFVRGQIALARGEPGEALAIADRLIETAVNRTPDTVIPSLWLLRGQALAALERPAEAEAALQAVRAATERPDRPPFWWQARVALGRLYQARRRPAEAAAEFDAARAMIEVLAATVPDEPVAEMGGQSLRANFLAAATANLPRARPLTSLRAAKAAFGGLTTREREVAALVAQGQSNREIAAALSVGETTIETHVSNILTKLDVTSRAQVAAWAVEKGLTAPVE
jgi:DNA-binding NarL/FixJ family response regulator